MATEPVTTAATVRPADVGLKREMGLIGGMWASETSLIGSGWLFGALYASQAAGTAALLAWVGVGLIFAVLALVYSELGAMYPVAGGTGRFPHFAFGTVAGISFGFFAWLQAVTVAPIECYAVMQYGSYAWHGIYNTKTGNVTGLGFGMAIVLMALFTLLNFFGMRLFSKVNSGITWWKIAIPLLAVIFLFTKFHSANFDVGGFAPYGAKGVFAATSAGVAFALLGFEQADQLAGEIKNPQKNLPRAILGALVIAIVIYTLLQVVFIGALPHSQLAHGFANISNSQVLAGPFAGVAGLAGIAWLAWILRLDAVISPGGTGLIYFTSTSRVSYGLARNRYYPPIFARTDSRGVPWFGLFASFVFGCIFLLPFPSWHALVGLVTSAAVLMYAGAPLSLGAFRSQVPDANRPYRMGGAMVLAPLAFILANFLIYWSGLEVIWKLGLCIVIGYVLIGAWLIFAKDRPPLIRDHWKAASWLPVYLIGMGIISWQGQYSGGAVAAPLNTGHLHLWVDLGVIAVFSLVIYYWAQAVRLPREDMLEIVARQSAEHQAATDT
jgi:amino acid transporter